VTLEVISRAYPKPQPATENTLLERSTERAKRTRKLSSACLWLLPSPRQFSRSFAAFPPFSLPPWLPPGNPSLWSSAPPSRIRSVVERRIQLAQLTAAVGTGGLSDLPLL